MPPVCLEVRGFQDVQCFVCNLEASMLEQALTALQDYQTLLRSSGGTVLERMREGVRDVGLVQATLCSSI